MARGRSERLIVSRIDGVGPARTIQRSPDELVVEEPMTIQLDGSIVATTMRTPGHDYELAAGFCFTDGLLAGAPVLGVRYCADGSAGDTEFNVVTVETGGRAPAPSPRLGNVSSSCGICGSDQIDALTEWLQPFPEEPSVFDLDVLATIPRRVAERQELYGATGAVHAAAAFDRNGEVLLIREDVGRHNAVDKVVGAILLADGDLGTREGRGLFVSGRASIEMVQKAWTAGFTALLAVSAPTALATTAARRANMLLVGFFRPDGFNIYSPERLR